MLAQPKLQPKNLNLRDPFGGKDPGDGAVSAVAGDDGSLFEERQPSPQAIAIMRQVVAARRAGDMDQTLRFALDTMRADPTSPTVQKLYGLVVEDRAKQMRRVRQTLNFLEQAVDAERAGNHERAVALAEQAAANDPHPIVKQFAQELRAKPALAQAMREPAKPTKNRDGDSPWWPLGAGIGLGALGYSVSRSRRAWSPQEHERPAQEDPHSERIQNNRYHLKVAAVSFAIGFGIVYVGPAVVATAGPIAARLWNGGSASLQRVVASEAGAIFPGKQPNQVVPALTGYSRHGLNQAISRDGVGVSPKAILDALKSPLNVVAQDGGKTMYVGRNATVVLNASGKVVTTWANNSSGARVATTTGQ